MTGIPAIADRRAWMARRSAMETRDEKHTPLGPRRRKWNLFKFGLRPFGLMLKACRLHGYGARRARDLRLVQVEMRLSTLPQAFDGYRILHLTDLHLDGMPGLADAIADLIGDCACDLMALTGDYRWRVHGPFEQVLAPLATVLGATTPADGRVATLGNHDPAAMAEPLERLGLRLLANETVAVERGGERVHITGLDDVHYYYTEDAATALTAAPAGCKIALVHSPEAAELAAAAGYALYLCGHTHGGQVCLPGGMPILTNSRYGRRFAKGIWKCGDMRGYTSNGAGTSGLPVRFFSHGEVTLITLRSGGVRASAGVTPR